MAAAYAAESQVFTVDMASGTKSGVGRQLDLVKCPCEIKCQVMVGSGSPEDALKVHVDKLSRTQKGAAGYA